jgi:mono/diheme cytochrome c family protein
MPSARALLRIPAAIAAPAALIAWPFIFGLPACSEQTGPTTISLNPTLSPRTKALGWGAEREQLFAQTLEFEVGSWEQPNYPRAWHPAPTEEPRNLIEPVEPEPHTVAQDQALLDGRAAYQKNCAQCHGWTGRGDGERAADLPRPPRDFSLGFTKYKNTFGSNLPLRADLAVYLNRPLDQRPADACPSLIADNSLELLYTEFLLMRNALEIGVVSLLDQVGVFATSSNPIEQEVVLLHAFEVGLASVMAQRTTRMEAEAVNRHNNPAATTPLNDEGTALIGDARRGKQLFTSAKAACATCHGVDGKGKGPQSWEPALGGWVLKDMWGNPAMPGDFTTRPLRGGDTEVDIWRSISIGVGGTPMPSFGTTLSTAQIADLVAYIQSFAR